MTEEAAKTSARSRARIIRRSLAALAGLVITATLFLAAVRFRVIESPAIDAAVARLFARNFGVVRDGVIFRGGQPRSFGRAWIADVYGFRTVVNLAWRDSAEDLAERAAFEEAGVTYLAERWDPAGPPSEADLERVLALFDTAEKPLFVHCIGGKDRTGGIVGIWERRQGTSLPDIEATWRRFKEPSHGWRQAVRSR